jgi:hypothetical protein
VYVHVLSWPDGILAIPKLGAHVRRASLLAGERPVAFVETEGGVTLTLPPRGAEEYDQVVVLETRR